MAIIWFSQKWWPWPCPSSDCQKKKFCIVACLEDIFCKKNQDDRTIRVTCRAFEDGQTDKQTRQTNRQTNRQTDRQTAVTNILFENRRFRKVIKAAIIGYFSNYIDFNWPWPLTLTFDLWTWPFIYFVRKNVMLWRNVRQNGASHIRMEITSR